MSRLRKRDSFTVNSCVKFKNLLNKDQYWKHFEDRNFYPGLDMQTNIMKVPTHTTKSVLLCCAVNLEVI